MDFGGGGSLSRLSPRSESVDFEDEPFSRLLRQWSADLADESPRPWWRAARAAARSSRWSVACCLVWLARLSADIALADSSEARRMPLRQFSGIYSCMWGVLFYTWRARAASRTLGCFLSVSHHLERRGGDASKVLLARTARSLRRVSLFYYFLGLTQVVGVTHTIFTDQASALAALLRRWECSAFFSWALYASHTLALLSGLLAYYTMLPVLLIAFRACSSLYRALGLECERADQLGEERLRRLGSLCARVTEGARRSRLLFADLFAHLLSTVLILPLLGTVELLVAPSDVDSLTVATFAVIATVFVPICLTGQELEDASTSLPWHLYSGPWLQEDASGRRLRAQLMLGSGTKARMAVGGLGSLNASSCLRVVNRWFSALNVFINMHVR